MEGCHVESLPLRDTRCLSRCTVLTRGISGGTCGLPPNYRAKSNHEAYLQGDVWLDRQPDTRGRKLCAFSGPWNAAHFPLCQVPIIMAADSLEAYRMWSILDRARNRVQRYMNNTEVILDGVYDGSRHFWAGETYLGSSHLLYND